MKSNPWPMSRYETISRACGVLVVMISGAALAGWFTDSVTLKGVSVGYIPMAPNTALVFLLLGTTLAVFTGSSKKFLSFARAGAVVAVALVIVRLSEYLIGLDLRVDHWCSAFLPNTWVWLLSARWQCLPR